MLRVDIDFRAAGPSNRAIDRRHRVSDVHRTCSRSGFHVDLRRSRFTMQPHASAEDKRCNPEAAPRAKWVWLGLIAVLSTAYWFLSVVLLHFLWSDSDPLESTISDYATGSYGYLMIIAFIVWGFWHRGPGLRIVAVGRPSPPGRQRPRPYCGLRHRWHGPHGAWLEPHHRRSALSAPSSGGSRPLHHVRNDPRAVSEHIEELPLAFPAVFDQVVEAAGRVVETGPWPG